MSRRLGSQTSDSDSAYDTQPAYKAVVRHDATPIIPLAKKLEPERGLRLGIALLPLQRAGSWAAVFGSAGLVLPAKLGENQDEYIKQLGERVISRTFE